MGTKHIQEHDMTVTEIKPRPRDPEHSALALRMYEGHSISNAILAIFVCLNMLFKFDLAFLKHKFNSPSARQFNTKSLALLPVA